MRQTLSSKGRSLPMRRIGLVGAVASALTIAASPAWATDLCIYSSIFASPLVAKNWLLPARNGCKPLHGFLPASMVAGTACTTPNGALLRIHFTTHLSDSNDAAFGACNFNLPALTGNCRLKVLFSSATIQSFADASAVATRCTGETVN